MCCSDHNLDSERRVAENVNEIVNRLGGVCVCLFVIKKESGCRLGLHRKANCASGAWYNNGNAKMIIIIITIIKLHCVAAEIIRPDRLNQLCIDVSIILRGGRMRQSKVTTPPVACSRCWAAAALWPGRWCKVARGDPLNACMCCCHCPVHSS